MPAWLDRLLGRDIKDPNEEQELQALREQGRRCKNEVIRQVQNAKKATQVGEFKAPLLPGEDNRTAESLRKQEDVDDGPLVDEHEEKESSDRTG